MKLLLTMSFLGLYLISLSQDVKFSGLKKIDNQTIELTLLSDRPFVIGAKDYYAYIDQLELSKPKIQNSASACSLIFKISLADFNNLPSISKIGIHYGKMHTALNPNNEDAVQSRMLIIEGQFDKSKLE